MGLPQIVRSAISIADKITKNLQAEVYLYRKIGVGTSGEYLYSSTSTKITAIVEERERLHRLTNGQEVVQKATITIPRPFAVKVDLGDKFVLPSGYFGPVLDVQGITDPKTNLPYMSVVVLG
jgi:hypothetical protein